MRHPAEPAVGGLGLGADPSGLLGLLALSLGGHAARVELARRLGLDLGISAQQGPGDLVGIHPDGKVQGVVEDVLAQVDRLVEDVVTPGPADRDPVRGVGGGQAMPADPCSWTCSIRSSPNGSGLSPPTRYRV